MKEFWVYTALRIGLFVGAFCLVFAVWFLVDETVPLLWVTVIAFLISGLVAFVVLDRQRSAFAQRVEARAGRMSRRYEEMRSKEDQD